MIGMAGAPAHRGLEGDHRAYDALDLRLIHRWLDGQVAAGRIELEPSTSIGLSQRYIDTADWRIHRAGVAARLDVDPTEQRLRIEALVPSTRPLEGIETTAVAIGSHPLAGAGDIGERLAAVAGRSPLVEVLTRDRVDTNLQVSQAGAPAWRLQLAHMVLPAGSAEPVRLNRVHLTMLRQEDPALTDLRQALERDCALRPTTSSSLQTAQLTLGLSPPPELELGSLPIDPSLSVGEVAFAVLRRQAILLERHEPGTRLGVDVEQLHDMRVASRRLRAAMRLFADYLPARTLRLLDQLSWLGRALGEVRDLDVQVEKLEASRRTIDHDQRHDLDCLVTVLEERRAAARRRMLRALDSRRHERLKTALHRALRLGPVRRSPAARIPIVDVAPGLIEQRYDRAIALGRKLAPDSKPTRFHRLRIRCKALRYALEFHGELYGRPARRLTRALVRVQDLLGDHQDADVAIGQLRQLIETAPRSFEPRTAFVIGILSERQRRRAEALRTQFGPVFEQLRGNRWRKLQQAMQSLRSKPIPESPRPRPAASPGEPCTSTSSATASPTTATRRTARRIPSAS